MLGKLAISNMKKMLKDYITLLSGLILAVSIFYMFNTLATNKEFIKENSVIKSISFVFAVGLFLLAVITIVYVIYTNTFFLSLRQKEFGMYMMLGAKRKKVARLIFSETLGLGIISIFFGVILGGILSKGMSIALSSLLQMELKGYSSFYIPSIIITVLAFLVMFFITSTINAGKLYKSTILDLINSDKQADNIVIKKSSGIIKAILVIILLLIGYYNLFNIKETREWGLIIGAFTITLATYLIFSLVMPRIINKINKNENVSLKGLNVFTIAQLRFRMQNLTKVLGTVTMLIALGAGAISAGLAFKYNVEITSKNAATNDIAIVDSRESDYDKLNNITFTRKAEYRYKIQDNNIIINREDLSKNVPYYQEYNETMNPTLVQVKDKLIADKYLVYDKEGSDLNKLPGEWGLAVLQELQFSNYINNDLDRISIYSESLYNKVQGEERKAFVGKTDDFTKYLKEIKEIDESLKINDNDRRGTTIYEFYYEARAFSVGTMFMGLFLGIAFLAMMASILMFKILSSASKERARYDMLKKIGVRDKLLVKSIYKEIGVLFLMPGLLGITHVLLGMKLFSVIILNPYHKIYIALTLFIVIYLVYYLITVQLYKKLVLENNK